jgi:murein L,D-transpeptidase YcbB/YkuD
MQIAARVLIVLAAAMVVSAPAWSDGPAAPAPQGAIAALVDGLAPTDADAASVKSFYATRNDAPAWSDPARVAALATAVAAARDQGLEASFPESALSVGGSAAERDVALTRLAIDYATDLAQGRVPLDRLETDWAIAAPKFDAAAALAGALDHGLAAWFQSLAPRHAAYRRLVAALARYRQIAADGGWQVVPRGDPLKLGMTGDRVRAARRRLEAEGDLAPLPPAPATAPMTPAPVAGGFAGVQQVAAIAAAPAPADDPASIFDDAMEQAVERFQRRYGIAIDGTIGPRTLAAMNVPPRARIEEIELNLERWRALPHDLGTRYMLVNVPAETLDVVRDGTPVIAMKVVVGDPDHPTPVLRTAMVAVQFNPTWTIPDDIVTNELLPKVKRDPAYLAKNDIVFTPGRGWQQMPGPKNPLGQIKFETPNKFDVYLHDTPSRFVFDRYFRAQSHGCVRLENAAELAGFVLRDLGWNEGDVTAAATSGATPRVFLKPIWRIWILYETAFVDEDGTVEFRDDLYGRDQRLHDALAVLSAAERQARL